MKRLSHVRVSLLKLIACHENEGALNVAADLYVRKLVALLILLVALQIFLGLDLAQQLALSFEE